MRDIKKAMEIEQKYIEDKVAGGYPLPLSEQLANYGYDTLEQYFEDKRMAQIKALNFTVQEVYPDTAAGVIMQKIADKEDAILLMNTDRTIVYHGDTEFNEQYCIDHGIQVVDYLTHGGALIASDGELSIGLCFPNYIDIDMAWLLKRLKVILEKYMDNVTIDHNDIMVEGKKVCGAAVYNLNERFAFIAQFSFDDKRDLIYAICPPVTGKEPGYITKMTREQMRNEVIAWLQGQ